MVFRVTRLRRQHYRGTLEVFLDGKLAGRFPPHVSGDVDGNGRVQQLMVKVDHFHDSPEIAVSDPGHDMLLAIVVSYTTKRRLFTKSEKFLMCEVRGEPIVYVPPNDG